MNPAALAISSAFLTACIRILFRAVIKSNADAISLTIFYNLGAAFLVFLCFTVPSLSSIPTESLLLLLLAGSLWAVAGVFDTMSYEHLDASVNGILSSLRFSLLTIGAVVFLGETLTLFQILGILLILYSVYITIDLSNAHFRRGALYRLISIMFINAGILIDKYLSNTLPPSLITVSSFLLPGILLTLIQPKKFFKIPSEIRKNSAAILLTPVLIAGTYGCYVLSFSEGKLVVASTLLQLGAIFTWILGVIILKERARFWRRFFASLLCTLGAVIVATHN